MFCLLRPLVCLFALLSVISGLLYPLLVTGIGKIAFPIKLPEASWCRRETRRFPLSHNRFQEPKYFWAGYPNFPDAE